ncbi:hypothetical protein [Paracraurococcus lichenis]|uniref:Uncharacterized protein n=1 Tax=Paracraurococcus lichenis TaxID=3064888 RepID=A0ABT9DWV5_9PROT|nr:hypothetical protein [Paracraurococcus sp. LOR1-02]MDO9708373.1 hypothetical protein [Paracraurococcus sp. LOR1-02]
MPDMSLTEAAAWGLIFGGIAYAILEARGVSVAAVSAALVGLATKTLLLELG